MTKKKGGGEIEDLLINWWSFFVDCCFSFWCEVLWESEDGEMVEEGRRRMVERWLKLKLKEEIGWKLKQELKIKREEWLVGDFMRWRRIGWYERNDHFNERDQTMVNLIKDELEDWWWEMINLNFII